jgi:hypothetical protein
MRAVPDPVWDDVPMIGTLNEGPLHAAIKQWYAEAGDLVEYPVDGYVIDLVRNGRLIEIQTGGFAPLREKLERLTESHPVRVVVPIPRTKVIVRMADDGEVLSRRRSPKRGSFADIFSKLVSWPDMVVRDGFELDLLLTSEEEIRVHRPGRAWRRRGWVVHGRALVEVIETRRLAGAEDLSTFLPDELPEQFTTADVAEALGIPRRGAQQMLYCLRAIETVEVTGKAANALVYRRT